MSDKLLTSRELITKIHTSSAKAKIEKIEEKLRLSYNKISDLLELLDVCAANDIIINTTFPDIAVCIPENPDISKYKHELFVKNTLHVFMNKDRELCFNTHSTIEAKKLEAYQYIDKNFEKLETQIRQRVSEKLNEIENNILAQPHKYTDKNCAQCWECANCKSSYDPYAVSRTAFDNIPAAIYPVCHRLGETEKKAMYEVYANPCAEFVPKGNNND